MSDPAEELREEIVALRGELADLHEKLGAIDELQAAVRALLKRRAKREIPETEKVEPMDPADRAKVRNKMARAAERRRHKRLKTGS